MRPKLESATKRSLMQSAQRMHRDDRDVDATA